MAKTWEDDFKISKMEISSIPRDHDGGSDILINLTGTDYSGDPIHHALIVPHSVYLDAITGHLRQWLGMQKDG